MRQRAKLTQHLPKEGLMATSRNRTKPAAKAVTPRSQAKPFKPTTKAGRRAVSRVSPEMVEAQRRSHKAKLAGRKLLDPAMLNDTTSTKEDTMTSKSKTRRTRKAEAQAPSRTSARKPRAAQPVSGKLTPADIAAQAKATPLEVRKHLRSQKAIKKGPEGWMLTVAQAAKVVKALKA